MNQLPGHSEYLASNNCKTLRKRANPSAGRYAQAAGEQGTNWGQTQGPAAPWAQPARDNSETPAQEPCFNVMQNRDSFSKMEQI